MLDDTNPKVRKAASNAGAPFTKRVKLSASVVDRESESSFDPDDDVPLSQLGRGIAKAGKVQTANAEKALSNSQSKTKAAPKVASKATAAPKRKYVRKAPAKALTKPRPEDVLTAQHSDPPRRNKDHNEFGWKSCADDDPVVRLQMKEEAVRQGIRQGEKVAAVLREMHDSAAIQMDSLSQIQNWLKEFDDAKAQHAKFRVFVGFAGVTGAGKTSAINSFIGFRDLLPSSNEAAATAVPCLIEYNNNPKYAFRAEVKFREKDDLQETLDQYYENLRQRSARSGDGDDDGDDDKDEGAYSNMFLDMDEDGNSDVLEMVQMVFGLEEEELNKKTSETVLSSNPAVMKLLGNTVSIEENDADTFAEKIKPYMDSVMADHGDNGTEFAAWPLIQEVKVFVRSDVLRNGVVLVDLPGLADNIESRASVARAYFQKLSVTAVVTPIIRARNEQTGVDLMTRNQELSMKMDGKFHKNSFCVILSKMDSIDVRTYLKQNTEARSNIELQGWLGQIEATNAEVVRLRKEKEERLQQVKAIDDKIAKLEAAEDDDGEHLQHLEQEKTEGIMEVYDQDTRANDLREQAKRLHGRVLHWCIRSRNNRVMKDINKDFAKRQKRLQTNSNNAALYDGHVNIFPVSSSVFWKIKEDAEPPVGYPTVQYTGVPAFTHWLRYATVPDREKHLDRILNKLHGLLNAMNAWSSNGKETLVLTQEFVETEVLQVPLSKLRKGLEPAFIKIRKDIKALDPMKNKNIAIANCKQRCVAVVARWACKDPNSNSQLGRKMSWLTYDACVKRFGKPFISHAPGRPRYAWIESLCNLFYDGIVVEWNKALNEEIPALSKPALEMIDNVWITFIQQLQSRVSVATPEMQHLFDRERASFEQIKELIKDEVAKKFEAIGKGAQKIHRSVTNSVSEKFRPAFNRAIKEKGKGMFQRQQNLLTSQAALRGNNLFKDSADNVDKQLKTQLGSLKPEFDEVIAEALRRVKQHVSIMLDNAVRKQEDNISTHLPPASKEKAQRSIRKSLAEWTALWRFGDFVDLTIVTMNQEIPERYDDDDEDDEQDAEDAAPEVESVAKKEDAVKNEDDRKKEDAVKRDHDAQDEGAVSEASDETQSTEQ